jgi:hypothetical protein
MASPAGVEEGSTGVLAELPPESRDTIGEGEPRSAEYWVMWSTCGEDSRADEAAANGGADAGWFLLDDFLEDPGLAIGDYRVVTCREALAVLSPALDNEFDRLASLLLAAEINLNSGAENCEAADQSLRASHVALAGLDYAGPGTVDIQPGTAILQLTDLLNAYNSGELCR